MQVRLGTCDFEEGESYLGANDALGCRRTANFECQSEECNNCICEGHVEECPACRKRFCSSPDVRLHDCFYLHETSGHCESSLIGPVLAQFEEKLAMPSQALLRTFVKKDGDGFGHPLPRQVSVDFALAALCLSGHIDNIPLSARQEQKAAQRRQRADRQREARACRKFGLFVTPTRASYNRVDLYKRSTVLISSGALIVCAFSGSPHYSQQSSLLRLIGIHKQEDYVRNRLNALKSARPQLYDLLLHRAQKIAQLDSVEAGPQQPELFL
jgi:hypothetical protein